MITVAIVGILAAIAVPAFIKYMKTSKTVEALGELRKIYDGELSYYDWSHVDPAGTVLSSQFLSAGPTPDSVPAGQKVMGNWQTAEWEALRVGMDAPTLYRYRAVAQGVKQSSSFTARAEGDLDGDSTTSLFERTGSVDPNTGEVVGGAGVYRTNDIE